MARSMILALAALSFAATTTACALFGAPSRVREGQLYRAGDPKYDAYFSDVHELQQLAVKWTEEGALARQGLVDELKLTPEATEAIIAQAAHERIAVQAATLGGARLDVSGEDVRFVSSSKGDGETGRLVQSIETMARAELVRAKRLKAIAPKCEGLMKTGHELETHVADDFAKLGGQKPHEVKQELAASWDALEKVARAAARQARDAESFVAEIQRAVLAGNAPAAVASAGAPKSPEPLPTVRPVIAAPRRPPPVGTAIGPVATAKPPPPPPPPSTGEVFNP